MKMMSRFRYSGTNWEGRRWTAAASIRRLGDQISVAFPTPSLTDGTVAGKAHDQVSPSSDHRPHPFTGPGIVRAIDAGVTPAQGVAITEALRASKDSRIKYVIFDGRIFSSTSATPYVWRDYDGSNPHATHFHLSTTDAADNQGHDWIIQSNEGGDDDMALTPEDLNKIADAVWFRLITHPVTGTQRGAQALLADAVKYAAEAAAKPSTGGGATADQVADKLSQRLAS
jgi:hypothetical protein